MKIGLISLLLVLSNTNFNILKSESEPIKNEANDIFVLANNITGEEKNQKISFETQIFTFKALGHKNISDISYKLDFSDTKWEINLDTINTEEDLVYCNVTFQDVDIDFTKTKYFSNKLTFTFNTSEEVIFNIYAIPSFIYFDESDLNLSVVKNSEFDIKLINGDGIINIEQNEVSIDIINNENDVLKEGSILTSIPYGKHYICSDATGKATIRYQFKRDLNGDKNAEIIKTFLINVYVIDGVFYFYEKTDSNSFEVINLENKLRLETFSYKEVYIGNIEDQQFDSSNISIKENISNNFQILDTEEVKENIDGVNHEFLKLRIMTGANLGDFSLIAGVKNNKKIDTKLDIEVKQGNYYISSNDKLLLNNKIFIYEPVDFYSIDNLILVKDNLNENFVTEDYKITFNQGILNRLGKQTIIADVFIDNKIHKYTYFNVWVTMNPKLSTSGHGLSTSQQIIYYQDLLKKTTNSTLSSYTKEERYDDLEYEYINSLSSEGKKSLASDFSFIRAYRNFIINNKFKTSFFKEIPIELGISRLIVPISIICVCGIIIIISLTCSLYYIYHQKGTDKDEK